MIFRHLEVRQAEHAPGISSVVLHGYGERGLRSEVVVALKQPDRDLAVTARGIDLGLHLGVMRHVPRLPNSAEVKGWQVVGLAPLLRGLQEITGAIVNDFPVQAHRRVVIAWINPPQREVEGAAFGDAVTLKGRIRVDRDRRTRAGILDLNLSSVVRAQSIRGEPVLMPKRLTVSRNPQFQGEPDKSVLALPRIQFGIDLNGMLVLSVLDIEVPIKRPLTHAYKRIVVLITRVQEVENRIVFNLELQLYVLLAR